MELRLYRDQDRSQWNQFVRQAKTNSFLFDRDFMEYHRDRFQDHSLLAFHKGELVAVLPANESETTFSSHGGLTYGGWLTKHSMSGPLMLQLFETLTSYLRERGFKTCIYKALPHIYHTYPAEEDLYALWRLGAVIKQRTISTTIDYREACELQERRKRGSKKALRLGYNWKESTDFSGFWRILEDNLQSRHGVKPVHSLEEIERLNRSFPQNIRLFTALLQDNMQAGVVVFETATVAHLQYISAASQGKDDGALDYLILHLVEHYRSKCRYFDFGISTEKGGAVLNSGLIEQKEGFGGRAIVYDIYSLSL